MPNKMKRELMFELIYNFSNEKVLKNKNIDFIAKVKRNQKAKIKRQNKTRS